MSETKRPKLTIGMAAFNDFRGVWFTVQDLRLQHPVEDVEIIVVDNNPGTHAHSVMTKTFIEGWASAGNAGARYIAMTDKTGTTQPRQRIFDEAQGDFVICMDSHVLLPKGVIARFLKWSDENPKCDDLLSGPMMYDHLQGGPTHFNDVWRDQMRGIWGLAWRCGCDDAGLRFSTIPSVSDTVDYRALVDGSPPVTSCGKCGKQLPTGVAWSGHEPNLFEAGYRPFGAKEDDPPFDIPGQGLGLFACRREAWLGFNPHFRGFGGEEMYIHDKFRMHGRRCLCLPWLRWAHCFGNPDGIQYPRSVWNKIRNYVLGKNELGKPLDEVKAHFLDGNLIPLHEWEYLIEDPVAHDTIPRSMLAAQSTCGGPAYETLEQAYKLAHEKVVDLNEHLPKLREMASKCDHVTEFGVRTGVSTTGLLAGQPRRFASYDLNDSRDAKALEKVAGATAFTFERADSRTIDIEETDMLFIDTHHSAACLYTELDRHHSKVRKWIALHDTMLYGETGEDGGPGLLPALRRFLKEHPEWSVVYHATNQYGFTVISKLEADKPKLPSKITMAVNLTKALTAHVADGLTKVSTEELQARLEVCSICDQRVDDRCAVCGCYLSAKAGMRVSECPLGKWPPLVQIEKQEAA